jgi:hypothetical protein
MKWNEKKIMQQVHVFRNLSTQLTLGIDGIDNLGIAYWSRTQSLIFQDEISHDGQYQKADFQSDNNKNHFLSLEKNETG